MDIIDHASEPLVVSESEIERPATDMLGRGTGGILRRRPGRVSASSEWRGCSEWRGYRLALPDPAPAARGVASVPAAAVAAGMRYSPRNSSQAAVSLTHVIRKSPRPAMPW